MGRGKERRVEWREKRKQRNRGSYERKKGKGGEKESWGWSNRVQIN